MAKRVAKKVEKNNESVGLDMSSIFSASIAKAAKVSGKDVTEFDGLLDAALVGIPLGHFALELLFSENVIDLGKMYCLDGMPGTSKSSFLWELTRLMDLAGGASCVIDTEKKATQDLGAGIVGHNNFHKINFASTSTFEEASAIMTEMVTLVTKAGEKTGYKTPVLMGLDSIVAATDNETEKIRKEGTASKGYAGTALLASRYLPTFSSDVAKLPMAFVAVRHEREVMGQNGIKLFEPKGGGEWQFRAKATFHFAKNGPDINLVGQGGKNLLIHLKKATDIIRIPVPFVWTDRIVNQTESIRDFKFHWAKAAFDIFTDPDKFKVPLRYKSNFKDVLKLSNVSSGKAACKPLGLETPVGPDELHKALYHPDNKLTLDMLRAAFAIRIGLEMRNGDDYKELKQKQKALILSQRDSTEAADVPLEDYEISEEQEEDINEE